LLVLDLSGLSFMDSSGMGVVAAAHARAVEAGRRFVVVGPPFSVRRAFEISNLHEVITIVADLESAYR
jgi:anti-anti-sigma factor